MDELHQARRLLDVDVDATRDELRRAFRQAAKKSHPDIGGAAAEFASVERAFRLVEAVPHRTKNAAPKVRYAAASSSPVAASRRPRRDLGSSFATVLARHMRDQPSGLAR